MNITKTTISLSLIAFLAFGASACTSNEQTTSNTQETQSSGENITSESVRIEAIKTLNRAREIRESGEYKKFYKEISTQGLPTEPDKISAIKKSFEENADLVAEMKSMISISDKNKTEYLNVVKMYNGTADLGEIEDIWNPLMDISAFHGEPNAEYIERADYSIIPGMVQEKDDIFSVTADYVYLQDKNEAVIEFVGSEKMTLNLENNGKKIVYDQNNEPANPKPQEWYLLQSDVKNVATQIESWVVSQRGRDTKILVEDNTLVDEFMTKDKSPYQFKLDEGTRINVEGTANAYIITGTYEGSDEIVTYDNQKGGLQNWVNKETKPVTAPKEPGADYTIWKEYLNFTKKYQDDNSIDYVVEALNKADENGTTYEVTEKNGKKYIKVNSSESKISETKDFLIAHENSSE